MSKKPEATFRAKIKRKLNKSIRSWGINDSFASGVPDVRYRGHKDSLWIEYKYYVSLPRVLNLCNPNVKKPPLSALQKLWLNEESKLGTNVAVCVGCPEGAILLNNFEWEREIPREICMQMLLTVPELVQYIENYCGVNDETRGAI